jgi:hypothetical protein
MKKLSNSIFIVICFFSICNSCSKQKNEEQLPAATRSGANTFGCFVNGKAWVPSGVDPTSGGFFGTPDGKRNIFIKAYSNTDYIEIYLKQIAQTGTYYLNKNTGVRPNFIYPESYGAYFINGGSYSVTDSSHNGVVKITYADTTSGIVSGTFEFIAKNIQTGDLINIINGRFDYKTH